MRLQPRDLQLLAYLADDFLLLARDQIQALIPRSKRRINQRLTMLVDAGYLSRRDPENAWSPRVVFYYLGDRAAEVLDRDRPLLTERKHRAASLADSHLRHLCDLAWIHVGFLRAPDKDYRLLRWTDPDRAGWDGASSMPIRPDAYLEYEKAGSPYAAFLEFERAPGTEKRTYLAEKIEDYLHYERSGAFQIHFGRDWLRVLFVTESEPRARALLKLFPSDTFWVATLDTFRSNELFHPYWQSPKGTRSLDFIPEHERSAAPSQDERIPDPPAPPSDAPDPSPSLSGTPLRSEFTKYLEEDKRETHWYWLVIPAAGVLGLLVTGLVYVLHKLYLETLELSTKVGLNTELLGLIVLAAIFALVRIAP